MEREEAEEKAVILYHWGLQSASESDPRIVRIATVFVRRCQNKPSAASEETTLSPEHSVVDVVVVVQLIDWS